jgi:hypothetical protein
MAKQRQNIQKFLVALNGMPEVREIFKAFYITGVETSHSIELNEYQKVKEEIITNVAEDDLVTGDNQHKLFP